MEEVTCPGCAELRADAIQRQMVNDGLLRLLDAREAYWVDFFLKHKARMDKQIEERVLDRLKLKLPKEGTMRQRFALVIALMLLAVAPGAVEAVGPLVGTNCTGSWVAPTANSDGTPITGSLVYDLYVSAGTPGAPTGPPKIVASGLSAPICPTLAAGQQTLWIAAMGTSESVLTSPFPFFVTIPNAPTGCSVANGVYTCAGVTLNTDGTPIAGPVQYEVWLMPAPATAPTGPPTLIATGPAVPVTAGLASGSYIAFRKTLTTPTPGGSTSESAVSAPTPFAISIPNPPTSVNVK